jgi:hypothetical protein
LSQHAHLLFLALGIRQKIINWSYKGMSLAAVNIRAKEGLLYEYDLAAFQMKS